MIMTSSTATSTLASSASTLSLSNSSPRSATPTPSDLLTGKHLIYRGLAKSSMEYMSLTHSNKQPEAAHTLKGEILISEKTQPGYIQYNITLDQEWMTRRVLLTSCFHGSQEKRVILEVDQDQRWYKVTEHRLARSRSFFRSGINSPANSESSSSPSPRSSNLGRDGGNLSRVSSESLNSTTSMSDVDSNSSDFATSDVESSISFEKINLTWTPPAKGSKRGSKRFSSFNPLKDTLPPVMSTPTSAVPPATMSCNKPCTTSSTTTFPARTTTASPTSITSQMGLSSSPPQTGPTTLRSPVVEFANRTLNKSGSSSSLNGLTQKSYEHIPELDGCIHLDLGSDISPSTLLLPLRRATLGIEPEEMKDHLASLMSCPSAVTSELTAVVSFPNLELRPVRTHVAYVGQGSSESLSIVERWTDEDDDESESTLVEVDEDGLAIYYGNEWARIRTC